MKEQAIEYFKFNRKIFCEDHLKILPKDSIAYHATLKEKKFYDMAIKALEQQPSDDCVSRQAVLAGINDWWGITATSGEPTLCDYIRELPPVTPTRKKGKWIEEPNCWLRCSCCNSHHPHMSIYAIRGSNYCPNCGAEMESEE